MNFKKINKILKKINNLHQTLIEEEDGVSDIEKQLFLSYVEKLYFQVSGSKKISDLVVETVIEAQPTIIHDSEVDSIDSSMTKPIISSEKEANESISEIIEDLSQEEVKQETILPVETKVEKKDEIVQEKKAVVIEPEIVTIPDPIVEKEEIVWSDSMKILFEPIEVKELSSKLANSPIKSIKSKLGINEKLLTVKELFSKDQEAFNRIVEKLDSYTTFEEATKLLSIEVVNNYGWLEEGKIKKATRFIQLVQRRYL